MKKKKDMSMKKPWVKQKFWLFGQLRDKSALQSRGERGQRKEPLRGWQGEKQEKKGEWRECEWFRKNTKMRGKRRDVGVCTCVLSWGWGGDLGKVSYIIIIPLSNGRAASPGEFVLNGRFARRTGQRERKRETASSRQEILFTFT